MSNNFLQGMQGIMSLFWRFATEVRIPGTNITVGAMGLFLVFAPLVLKFLTTLFGVGGLSQGNQVLSASSSKKEK